MYPIIRYLLGQVLQLHALFGGGIYWGRLCRVLGLGLKVRGSLGAYMGVYRAIIE